MRNYPSPFCIVTFHILRPQAKGHTSIHEYKVPYTLKRNFSQCSLCNKDPLEFWKMALQCKACALWDERWEKELHFGDVMMLTLWAADSSFPLKSSTKKKQNQITTHYFMAPDKLKNCSDISIIAQGATMLLDFSSSSNLLISRFQNNWHFHLLVSPQNLHCHLQQHSSQK
jgi:hypothetical protein